MRSLEMFKAGLLLTALTILGACQTTDLSNDSTDAQTNAPNTLHKVATVGDQFLWGGKILAVENRQDTTEITVLSYPLSGKNNHKFEMESTGRFIAVHHGYLEPLDYVKGHRITVVGTLAGFREGSVSNAEYNFPLLDIEAIQLHKKSRISFPFSISVGFGF